MFKAKKPKLQPLETKMAGAFNQQAPIDYKQLIKQPKTTTKKNAKKK